MELLGTNLVHRRDYAAQNMVEAMERTGTLNCRDILGLRNNANFAAISGRVQADVAFVARCIVEADRAKMHLLLKLQDGLRQTASLLGINLEKMVGYALSRLWTNAW